MMKQESRTKHGQSPRPAGETTVQPDAPAHYEIRVKGHLAERYSSWFQGLAVSREDSGETLLTGPVMDQAALHGLLRKVRDLGLALVSVNPVAERRPAPNDKQPGPATGAILSEGGKS